MNMIARKPSAFGGIAVTGFLVLIVMSMVLPLPPTMLDMGIALSIATATMILVMASLVDKPTEFQAFPVLLLVSLLMRLSLNVSSTRLILTNGHVGDQAAGQVISGFSNFVAGGSLLVGLTVFAVISAVNFIVITKGSGRMAEVSARFALDSLPGKQLAIDGDLNSGAITHEEAKRRRQNDQQEINFFGSLDGASKFVKGDAIAGIVITLINLVVGMSVGVIIHGMNVADAADTYSRLSIGDGLVSQIPSLITSMAAALLLSRGGATDTTAEMLTTNIFGHWRSSAVVGGAMFVLSFVPGMPKPIFWALGIAMALNAWRASRVVEVVEAEEADDSAEDASAPARRIGDEIDMDEIVVEIGSALVPAALDTARGLGARISNLRVHIARTYGLILPEVRITDDTTCGASEYLIRVQGVTRGKGTLRAHMVLALGDESVLKELSGDEVRDPVYGSAAKWISHSDQEDAALAGATTITPIEVLSTHLMEAVRSNLSALMTLSAMQKMIAELKGLSDRSRSQHYQQYFDNIFPDKLQPEVLLAVLRQMLDEGLSIRNLTLITDATYEARQHTSAEQIYEAVRKRLRGPITERYSDESGQLQLLQLHPAWEAAFQRADPQINRAADGAVSANVSRDLVRQTKLTLSTLDPAVSPALATPDHRRRQVREILNAHGVAVPVIGLEEIDPAASLRLLGTVEAA